MNKITFISCVITILGFSSLSSAATVGNTPSILEEQDKFSLGIEYDGVYKRSMKMMTEWSEPLWYTPVSGIEAKSNHVYVKASMPLKYIPLTDFYVKTGCADLGFEFSGTNGSSCGENEFKGDFDFVWGLGIKGYWFPKGDPNDFTWMMDIQCMKYKMEGDYTVDGVDFDKVLKKQLIDSGYTNVTSQYTSVAEQLEASFSLYGYQNFEDFTLYGGFRYSSLRIENITKAHGTADGTPWSGRSELIIMSAHKRLGLLAGANIPINKHLDVTIEGRFVDEQAAAIGVTWTFERNAQNGSSIESGEEKNALPL